MKKVQILITLSTTFLAAQAFASASCPAINLNNPKATLYFLKPNSEAASCQQIKVKDLQIMKAHSLGQPVNECDVGFFGKILNFFRRARPAVVCHPALPQSNDQDSSSLLGKTSKAVDWFSRKVDLLLKDDHYKTIDGYSFFNEYSDAVARIEDYQSEVIKISKELGNFPTEVGKKKPSITDRILNFFNSSKQSKLIGGASDLIGKGLEKVLPEVKLGDRVPMKVLLPDDSFKLQMVQLGHGISLLTLGALNLALTPGTAGASAIPLGAAGSGVSLAAAVASQRWSNPGRALLLKGKQTRNYAEYIKVAGSGTAAALHTLANVDPLHFAHQIPNLITYSPIVGGVAQIGIGLRSIYESIYGYERGHEVLKKYEQIYKKTFSDKLDENKRVFDYLLGKAQRMVRPNGHLSPYLYENPEFISQVSCLCAAQEWTKNFEKEGNRRFDNRIKYLDRKLSWKKSRRNFFNRFRFYRHGGRFRSYYQDGDPRTDSYRAQLVQFTKDLKSYRADALRENQKLRDKLPQVDHPAKRIDSQLGEAASSPSIQLTDLEDAAQELNSDMGNIIAENYELSNKILSNLAMQNPEKDWSILLEETEIGNGKASLFDEISKIGNDETGNFLKIKSQQKMIQEHLNAQKKVFKKVHKHTK